RAESDQASSRTVLVRGGSAASLPLEGAAPPLDSCRPLETNEDGRNERRELPLQIRLEIDVVANFSVYLQPIPLAIGHDDAIGFWIEVYCRWEAEAIFGLQALHPTASLHHVGVRVDAHLAPLRHHLGITDEIGDRVPLRVEDADPMIAPVGHVDI